ncbi:SPOR domain-containing protein [Parabacteroides sp. ZJ-118]|uniref:HU domain-containing protein n=1 Tax=Parabacteroides sp. ZJ-118 TaxID=2709398 RepID=UPI0013EDB50E|nr:SPOR domain-containing protein [Parabacteroides sp. ZJ-118]
MLRIVTHIERLLLAHDCVILPKFGGFVRQAFPATCQEEEHLFRPMRKEVVFNGTLQHTDGLLSESYMRVYGVDYRKAQLMLEEDIEALNVSLEQDKRITLGRIGTFCIGEEGQTIFTPGDSGVFNADSYGLSSFHFPVLRSLEEEREEVALLTGKKKKDVFYIPVSRKLIRVVAASAAAVALFFVVSTPVEEVSQSAYTASFVPTEMVNYSFEEPISRPEEIQVSLADEMMAEVTPKEEALKDAETTKAPSAPEVRKEVAVPAPKVESVASKKMYHVVIASFPTAEQANEFISGVDRTQCKNVNTVVRDGKYRIYADKFNNRADAESYMATLRKIEKYKDAWLFISR